MKRGPSTFRKRDIVAAVRAVEEAGAPVERVEIGRDGTISIVVARASENAKNEGWGDLS